MPHIPEAKFSVLKSHVISAHYTSIETECLLCVFVISLVVWSTRILPNGFDYPICSEHPPILKWSSMVYLQSNHLCVIYGQISTTVLFIPPATKLWWYIGFTLSVCPSVRLSVCLSGLSVCLSVCLSVNLSCPPCSIYSSGWILSIFGTNDQ